MTLDYSKISNISVADINMRDYPDFCDAFIEEADYDGRPMTEAEIELLNEDRDFVYEAVLNEIY